MRALGTQLPAVLVALGMSVSVYAQIPAEVIGVYSRSTPTCGFGGPGGADRPSSGCSGGEVFEDRLEVSATSAAEAYVSFALHFNIAQNLFCTYNGAGNWRGGKLSLGPSE